MSRVIAREPRSPLTVTEEQLTAELDEITDAHTDLIAQNCTISDLSATEVTQCPLV